MTDPLNSLKWNPFGKNGVEYLVAALGAINPFVAAALHNLSTLLVVFNSARLIGYDPDPGR
jgi:manganese-transporting P-type ATPase C